jgi:hypothetical protein
MNYMSFDPYLMIRQRNEEMLQEVRALRLGDQLRTDRDPRGWWLVDRARRGMLPLLRRVGLVQ